MKMTTENTAPMTAISQTASKVVIAMPEEQFEREKLYQASMNHFKSMLEKDLITEKQYAIIDKKMLEKYSLMGYIIRRNNLIIIAFRVIYSSGKELILCEKSIK